MYFLGIYYILLSFSHFFFFLFLYFFCVLFFFLLSFPFFISFFRSFILSLLVLSLCLSFFVCFFLINWHNNGPDRLYLGNKFSGSDLPVVEKEHIWNYPYSLSLKIGLTLARRAVDKLCIHSTCAWILYLLLYGQVKFLPCPNMNDLNDTWTLIIVASRWKLKIIAC